MNTSGPIKLRVCRSSHVSAAGKKKLEEKKSGFILNDIGRLEYEIGESRGREVEEQQTDIAFSSSTHGVPT